MRKRISTIITFTAIGLMFFGCKGELLYRDDTYTIRKKNLVSYYQSSPDLFVKTAKGEIKINLNGFGKPLIPQEKITGITVTQINNDSVQIHFTTTDTTARVQEEYIGVNIKYAVDSIMATMK